MRINIFPIPEADAYRWGCHKRKPYEVGYESVSRFNREYSRFFAQPPMRDVKALRASSEREYITLLCRLNKEHTRVHSFYLFRRSDKGSH